MEPYATIDDLQARWRTLSPSETETAKTKLQDASVAVALEAKNSGVAIDAADALMGDALKAVVCEMVKRAIVAPVDQAPVSQNSVTAGPFSEQFTFINPAGDLYMTNAEKRKLGFKRQRVGSIAPRIGGGRLEG